MKQKDEDRRWQIEKEEYGRECSPCWCTMCLYEAHQQRNIFSSNLLAVYWQNGDEMIFFGQSVHSHCIFDIIGNTGILHIIYSLLDRVVPSLCVKFPRGVVYSYRWLRNLGVMVSKARLYLIPWGEKVLNSVPKIENNFFITFLIQGK